MVFGTFDILHPGHLYFLTQAKKSGSFLTVLIARDQTVLEVKGKLPQHDEATRFKNISDLKIADRVVLGNLDDKYQIIKDEKPDIIALGYDQRAFTDKLADILDKKVKIIKIKPFKEDIYKSSKLRNK